MTPYEAKQWSTIEGCDKTIEFWKATIKKYESMEPTRLFDQRRIDGNISRCYDQIQRVMKIRAEVLKDKIKSKSA